MTKGAIQKRFREIAETLSYINLREDALNPARPHSLRSAFRTLLTAEADGDLIETFLAHTSETKGTYINFSDEALREEYAKYEHLLSVETTSKDVLAGRVGELRELDGEYKEKMRDLETTLRTQAQQLSQLVQLNERLDGEVKEHTRRVVELEGEVGRQGEARTELEGRVNTQSEKIEYVRNIAVEMIKKYMKLKEVAPEVWEQVEKLTGPPEK